MITLIRRLQQPLMRSLWEVDPGYLHLRQGYRTLIAALITLLICPWPELSTRVLACFAAGLVCQGINGATLRQQKINFAISTAALVFYFALISYVNPYPLAMGIVITCASFSVFASKSFGIRFERFPLFTWIMGFMTSLFPQATAGIFNDRLVAIVIGCIISFIVYFYVLPPRHLTYFFKNIRYFLTLVQTKMVKLQQQLTTQTPFRGKNIYRTRLRQSLRKYYLHNQNILASFYILESAQKAQLLHLLSSHYLAGKALLMLQDNLITLAHTHLLESLNIQSLLCQALQDVNALTHLIQVDTTKMQIYLSEDVVFYPKSFDKLRDILESSDEKPETLVPLYHLIISLNELRDRLLALTDTTPIDTKEEVYHAQ